jgi:hypothetical protein
MPPQPLSNGTTIAVIKTADRRILLVMFSLPLAAPPNNILCSHFLFGNFNREHGVNQQEMLSVSDNHWHKAAEMAFDLRRKGVASSAVDTLIAILAIDHRCIFL